MSNLIKKIINLKGQINASPFSIFHAKFIKLEADVSDFFTFRLDKYETVFIAENSLGLLTAKVVSCRHFFHFFDGDGKFLNVHEIESDELHYKLFIDIKMTAGVEFGGFTHHVQYSDELLQKYKALLNNLVFQHRGYSGFRKKSENGFSYMHGNFGGLYIDKKQNIQSLARSRGKHTYTPQFIIKSDYSYDLIFSNPVDKYICIKFILIDGDTTQMLEEVCLNAYATHKLVLDGSIIKDSCNIAWETSLPVGRCAVFEYNNGSFDVFHS